MKATIENSEGFSWRTQGSVSWSGLRERERTFSKLRTFTYLLLAKEPVKEKRYQSIVKGPKKQNYTKKLDVMLMKKYSSTLKLNL